MTEAADFMCPRCTSRYKLVRVRADPKLPSRLTRMLSMSSSSLWHQPPTSKAPDPPDLHRGFPLRSSFRAKKTGKQVAGIEFVADFGADLPAAIANDELTLFDRDAGEGAKPGL